MPSPYRQKIEIIGLFLCSLILFTWGLSSQEIISFDSRFYLFAKEMQHMGVSFFPLTYHQPYPDYSSASTLFVYISAILFGGLNKLTAVLPSAIMAAITVVFTYLIGSLRQARWGLCAALFMVLTLTFLKSARGISLDMYTTCITTICFYLLYLADEKDAPRYTYWLYPLLIISFIFRGPIGLVMPAGVVCAYYLLTKSYKKLCVFGAIASVLLILCSALLLLLAYHVGGDTFMHAVMRMQVLGRMDNYYLPRYFYFQDGLAVYALSFPLSWLVLAGAAYYGVMTRGTFSRDRQLLLTLAGWMLVIVLGMSIPDDKKIRYILPMVPAAALIAAYPFVGGRERYFVYLRWLWRGLFLLFPGLLLAGAAAVSLYAKHHDVHFPVHTMRLMHFLICMQALNAVIFYRMMKYGTRRDSLVLFIAALSFAVSNLSAIEPIENQIDSARDFVNRIEKNRLNDKAQLVFYKERPDGLPIKYLINMSQDEKPLFIDNAKQLLALSQPAYFVASESYFADLPPVVAAQFHVLAKDSLGHTNVVVFAKS